MKKIYFSFLLVFAAGYASAQSTNWMPADSAQNLTKPGSGPGDPTWNIATLPLLHNGTAYGASSTLTGGGTNIVMDHAFYHSFNLAVPGTATITGVEVIVSRFGVGCSSGTTADTFYLGYGGVGMGSIHSASMTNAYSTDTLGSSTDMWGNSLTPSWVNSPNFGVYYDTRVTGACSTIALQDLRVKVHYQTSTGVNEVAYSKALHVYPNPATATLSVISAAGNYIVTDNLGRKVLEGRMSKSYAQLDVSSLTPGLYFIQCGEEVVKFVKE